MTKPTIYSTFPIPARRRVGEAADVNADFMTTGTLLNTPTLYPSAYLVLTSKGYTKHYYAGADRVAASLGGGGLKAVGSNPGMQERADWLFWESHERVNGRMLQETGQALPAWEYYGFIKDIPGRMNASVEFKLDDFHKNLEMLAEEQHDEKDVYFYHSDHLGGASWITDADGKPVQHLQYLPFGEPYVNQHPAGYQERFTFTGKERDEETGYGYFGARYMDYSMMTSFISVDRYASKYPFISPYAYCAWNPIRLIDPTGDTIVVNRYGDVIRHDHTDNSVYLSENNKMTRLGELGGEIKADYIYSNLLNRNAKIAKSMWNPFKFRELVRTKGDWDLKNNNENKITIYGLGNDNKTIFLYNGNKMESQDLGNHHFGYVAKAFGLFSEEFILRQAGSYQIQSGTSKPEWQIYEDIHLIPKPDPMSTAPVVPRLLPPYGDDPRDQMWIRKGFSDYDKSIKK